jgi:hypothetical protein
MDLHNDHLVAMAQSMRQAHSTPESNGDEDSEEVSGESPTRSKQGTIQEADKPCQRTKTTILEFIPDVNAWKVSNAETQHMSPARGHSVALNTTPPRVRRALDRKQAKKDAWKQAILRFRKTYGTSD